MKQKVWKVLKMVQYLFMAFQNHYLDSIKVYILGKMKVILKIIH